MTVQPMAFDFNQLNPVQKTTLQATSGTRTDDFSFALERSQKQHEVKERLDSRSEAKVEAKDKLKDEPVSRSSKEKPITKEVGNAKESTTKKEVSVEDESKKVMDAIAHLLQITTDQLEELLATMELGIDELLQGNNLQQLMLEVHNLEDPIELLQIPGIVSDIKMITSTLEEYEIVRLKVSPEENLSVDGLDQLVKDRQIPNSQVQITKEPAQNTDINSGTSPQGNIKPENHLKDLNADSDSDHVIMTPTTTESSENTSQDQGQLSQGQENLANQFVDNLSQSMVEAFQGQSDQVNNFSEIAETVKTSAEIVDPKMVLDQIVEKIKVSTIDEQARMNIQLKPEHLGKLSMEVVSKQGIMTAQFIVDSEKTKQLLEQNIQNLRETLEGKGLVIQELEVTVGQNQKENNQAFQDSKSKRNVSDIIEQIMNEEIDEEADLPLEDGKSEVDYIA